MNKLCINVFCGFEFEELCKMAKEAGFDGVFSDECDAIDPQKIKQNRIIADKYSLYYETSHAKIPGCTNIWNEAGAAAEYEKVLKKCIENCAENGIPILVVHIQTDRKNIDVECGMNVLTKIVAYAEMHNVKIAFENINNADLLYYVLDRFKSPNVGFCYDCGHELCHTPAEDYLSKLGDRLFCTHLHDNDGKRDLHELLYTDKIDFDRIALQLKRINYKGALTLELSYKNDMSKTEFITKAYNALQRLRNTVDN